MRRGQRVIAVVGRNTNLLGVRTPSRLELSYLQTAADLTQMIAGGHFPVPGQRSDHADTPRVGDGFLRVDEQGRVVYASPNALSVYRRLGHSGDLDGLQLSEVTRELVPTRLRPDEEALSAVLGGRAQPGRRDRRRVGLTHRPRHPAAAARPADRRAGTRPRRHRPAPS